MPTLRTQLSGKSLCLGSSSISDAFTSSVVGYVCVLLFIQYVGKATFLQHNIETPFEGARYSGIRSLESTNKTNE